MLRRQGCVYLFEWATPIVCPDTTRTDNCQLTDSQLQFTFDLSTLSGEVQVSSIDTTFGLYPHCCCERVVFKKSVSAVFQVPVSSGVYHINVCSSVAKPACNQSAVCRVSGSGSEKSASSFGLTKAITMDYKHEEETVLMQYGGGDPCPPGTSAATLNECHQGKETKNCDVCSSCLKFSTRYSPQSPAISDRNTC